MKVFIIIYLGATMVFAGVREEPENPAKDMAWCKSAIAEAAKKQEARIEAGAQKLRYRFACKIGRTPRDAQ